MKNKEKNYIKSVKVALLIDFVIIICLYVITQIDYIINPYITDILIITGVILFLYSIIFPIVYFTKIIISFIMKKDKYSKKEMLRDFKLLIISIISLSIIFLLFYSERYVVQGSVPLKKPVIYLYPETSINVTVKLSNEEDLTHTYPKYIDGWNVVASPNGNLVDIETNRNLYCLYWEGKDNSNIDMTEGFVIKGSDTIKFLEDKLSVLGLNERETNEFIIYWLPQMENNKYNYIRFRTNEEINSYMKLDITPKPDSVIRVIMDFKPLHKYISVNEQKLSTPLRSGFVVVEWGAREL